ncbi:adrenocorticotropic hormone receptor-like [Galendromus occidentalis]|uniref:Adrenocorticotropic hormone receptor-like n=1 Tax=Galendromus occidentalis TaxID=34638 RepID=A0AAJ6QRL2_9ACAR|nr:adrenocorticotropic hormone receptor-like [Galendromus occidentalis]
MILRLVPSLLLINLGAAQMLPPSLNTRTPHVQQDAVLTERVDVGQLVGDVGATADYSDSFNLSDPCTNESYTASGNFEQNCSQIAVTSTEDYELLAFRIVCYQWLIVFMSIAMVASIVTNLMVLFSARYIRKVTPTVFFSLSLVAANAYATIIFTLSMTINSFLTTFIRWSPNVCWALLLEVFRMTGLSASALHLLALAINHYVGILRPLHYASTVTRRRLTLVIIALWVVPFIIYLFLFLDRPENDFYRMDCNFQFMKKLPFRLTVSSLFCVPLIIMTVLYIHIFITVKRNHSGFLMGQKNQAGNQHIKRNVKAVITTLLILGTYLIGYMPAVVFYVLTCDECLCPLSKLSGRTVTVFGVLTNCLIFVKCLSDPIIYTIRMPEVRNGLRRMWLTRCCTKYLPGTQGGSDRKRTMTSTRSDMIPLNRRSAHDRIVAGNYDESPAHNGTGYKHLRAKTSLNSAAKTETALA